MVRPPAGWRWGHFARPDAGMRRIRSGWARPEVPRSLAVIAPGYNEFGEKYVELAGELLARGHGVLVIDWIGQGGSLRPGPDPRFGWMEDLDHHRDDLIKLIEEGLPPDLAGLPILIFAHSMGGLITLAAMERHPDLARALVLSAPLLGLALDPLRQRLGPSLARMAVRLGLGGRPVPGQRPWVPNEAHLIAGDPVLSSDPLRGSLKERWYRARPALRLGGVSWAWLDAVFRGLEQVTQPANLARLSCPVLIGLAGDDRVVSNAAIRTAAAFLPTSRLVEIEGAAHELWMECHDRRQRWWKAVDSFLDGLDL